MAQKREEVEGPPTSRNLLQLLRDVGLPPAFVGLGLTLLLALTLAPFLGGLGFGNFKVPLVPQPLEAFCQYGLPILWVLLLVPLIPPMRRGIVTAIALGAVLEVLAIGLGAIASPQRPVALCLGDFRAKIRDMEPRRRDLQTVLDDFYSIISDLEDDLGRDYSEAAEDQALPRQFELHRKATGNLTVCAHLNEIERAFNSQHRDAQIQFYVDCSKFYVRMEDEPQPEGAELCP